MIKNIFIFCIILSFPIFLFKEYSILKSKKYLHIASPNASASPNGSPNAFPNASPNGSLAARATPVEDKYFTFIVLILNDAKTIEKNYESILNQNYNNYNVIYIDQGSSDATVALLKKHIGQNLDQHQKAKIIECQQTHEAYQAYYQEVLMRADSDIIVHLYGSDWLAHENVLVTLSQWYSHPKVWLSYAQYLEHGAPQNKRPFAKSKTVIEQQKAQKTPWLLAPLKTYYAGLLKKIEVYNGFFLSIENENAILSPIAKLSASQVRFIPDVLFIHSKKQKKSLLKKRG